MAHQMMQDQNNIFSQISNVLDQVTSGLGHLRSHIRRGIAKLFPYLSLSLEEEKISIFYYFYS